MVVTGIYYALALTVLGLVTVLLGRPIWGIPFYGLALFCLYFFRDPEREIPDGPVAVAPADGKVVAVVPAGDGRARISVFMSVFDVHVNRAPVAGRIVSVEYKEGQFLVASREAASERNERNTVTVEGDGSTVVFRQIAGLVARRIRFHKKPDDEVAKGERVGMIQFGSRLDVILGPEWEIVVKEGDRVEAGSGVVARRREQAAE
jgi:phosphatidylserine decarboxylase